METDDSAEYTFWDRGVRYLHSVLSFKFLGFKVLNSKFFKAGKLGENNAGSPFQFKSLAETTRG